MRSVLKELLNSNTILILVIFLSTVLRFYKLSQIPIGFNDDEAAFGYNAYSILSTGKDEWGRLLPFPTFESFGDWKLVLYLYLTVISQFFLGVGEFATRLPSALFGVLAVFSTFLLAKKLFNKKIGIVSAFFLSISPWHIAASRNAFESDILILFISLSLYFFIKGLENPKFLTLSFIGFALSMYIYRSAWVFVPIFILCLIYIYRQHLKNIKIHFRKNIILFLILLTPLINVVITFKGQSRFFQESFITGIQKQGIIDDVNERRGVCQNTVNLFVCRIIYNKYSFFLLTYISNYFSNLSPETYYIKGSETGYQFFPQRGFFYTFELPLLIAGLIFLLRNRQATSYVLISYLLIVPIGPSLTGVGNPGRLNILMPIPQIITAIGLIYALSFLKRINLKIIFLSVITILISTSVIRFGFDLLFHSPYVSARYQRYGYKQLFHYLESQKSNYNQIIVSRKSDDAKQYIHYIFFTKFDPATFQSTVIRHRDENGWVVVEEIGKLKFVPTLPPIEFLPDKSLVATGEKEIELNVKPIYTINDFRGDRLFEVYNSDQLKVSKKRI